MDVLFANPSICYNIVKVTREIRLHALLTMLSRPYFLYQEEKDECEHRLSCDLGVMMMKKEIKNKKAVRCVQYRIGNVLHSLSDQPSVIDENGIMTWYRSGRVHRDGDLPAKVRLGRYSEWYKNGVLHRDGDEPAVISKRGREWYKNGVLHRDGDEPAVIRLSGEMRWYKNGVLHRDGDEPALIDSVGTKVWYKNGKRHRGGDKPTLISPIGTMTWYRDDKKHRDGILPARLGLNDNKWYKDGTKVRVAPVTRSDRALSWRRKEEE